MIHRFVQFITGQDGETLKVPLAALAAADAGDEAADLLLSSDADDEPEGEGADDDDELAAQIDL